MLDFVSNNYVVITSITSIGTLFVWIFYAHLLYSGYKRQRRPRVLINKGIGGEFIDSPCLICNMSQEPVFLYFLMVKLKTDRGEYLAPMTDREGDELPDSDEGIGLRSRTRQGPLRSGDCLEFVTFRRMIQKLLDCADIEIEDGSPIVAGERPEWIEVHVICIYGSERRPFGAVRRFLIDCPEDGARINLVPDTLDTASIRSKKYRRQIDHWLRRYL